MIQPQKGKIVVNLVENIRGEKLKHFINFCFDISDEVILVDEFSAHMLKDEAKEAIYKSSTRFEKMGMSIEDINERIADSQERIEQIGSSYAISQDKIEVLKDKYLVQYGLKKREVTCETHCTLGGEKIQYYFTSEGSIKAKFEKMQTLYDRIILAKEEFELDDPAFCKDGEVICSICSHEHMGSLVLTQEQYQVFRQLRIPHDAANINDIKEEKVTLDLIILGGIAYYPLEGKNNTKAVKKLKSEINDKREELILTLKEYAYQEREGAVLWGWHQEAIPEEIGEIKTLKKLEIFDNEVKYLPRSLEKLTELECLRITGNKVSELGFDIAKLQRLEILDLSAMPLKIFPVGITELKNLKALYLSAEHMSEVPEALMALKNLKVVSISEIDKKKLTPKLKAFLEKLEPKNPWDYII